MVNKINLLSEPKNRILQVIEAAFAESQQSQIDRAFEIVQEEYEKLIRGMISKSRSWGGSGVRGAEIVTEKVKYTKGLFNRNVFTSYIVFVDDNNDGGVVFNILDQGEKWPKGEAANYGLKAWPMRNTRTLHMTEPDSLQLKVPNTNTKTIFRPVITKKIEARNFTRSILKAAKKRAEAEGLEVTFTLED